ncbi:MAG: F0F1 ATP synthase subunit delta [Candidatus Omnitrophica bacterium]|nr:F0F1 ATP synthase subunit delta [Candidatus Omnitrophota bacterium]
MFIASLIITQVFIFVGLIIILRRVMVKNLSSATRHLDELSQDYTQKEEEINVRLEEAKKKAEQQLKEARDEAERLKAQIIKDAEEQRDRLVKQARGQSDEIVKQADRSRQLLLAEINERIAKEAVDKACELIQDTLPEQFKLDAHTHWVEELIQSGFGQLSDLRIPEDARQAMVTSAFPLKEEQRKEIFKKLKKISGSLEIKEETDPKVVAGLIITIGSLVLDGSLKNKIKEKAQGF